MWHCGMWIEVSPCVNQRARQNVVRHLRRALHLAVDEHLPFEHHLVPQVEAQATRTALDGHRPEALEPGVALFDARVDATGGGKPAG